MGGTGGQGSDRTRSVRTESKDRKRELSCRLKLNFKKYNFNIRSQLDQVNIKIAKTCLNFFKTFSDLKNFQINDDKFSFI